jgi:hypothetical protein
MEYVLSERGMPLIVDAGIQSGKFLTLESYMKWYDFYILDMDTGVAEKVISDLFNHVWYDHSVVPKAYAEVCNALDVQESEVVYDVIIGRFLTDILNDDATHLNKYL